MQQEILNVVEKEGFLFGTEIIERLRKNGEYKEWVRKSLQKMRKYKEINFIEVTGKNCNSLAKRYPYLKDKVDNGYKPRRCSFLYYSIDKINL